MCVGVPFQCGYGGVMSLCSLKHYFSLYSTIKMMHGPINIRFTSLFLAHKFNLCVVIYFNISYLQIFNNYLVYLFLSISHRLESFFILVMKSSAETSLLRVSMSFSKTVFPMFPLCKFSAFNELSSHLIIFISLSECSASTWSFAVDYISIWDLSFFP